jgi:group I intron endonuclease
MRTHYLYKLLFPNGKIYIGQTVNFKNRMNQHKNDSLNIKRYKKHLAVNNAIVKYGWDSIKKEIILETNSSLIDELEKKLILDMNSNSKKNGYNIDIGGHSNKIMADSTKKKIALSRLNKRQWTKTVYQINKIDKTLIKVWDSVIDAARGTNTAASSISAVCNGYSNRCRIKGKDYYIKRKFAGGYIWSLDYKQITT